MDDDGAVSKEGARARCGGEVEIKVAIIAHVSRLAWRKRGGGKERRRRPNVRSLERARRDLAMFARQITDLACRGLRGITGRDLAALGRI